MFEFEILIGVRLNTLFLTLLLVNAVGKIVSWGAICITQWMKKNLIILEVIIVCTLVKGLILFLSFCFLLDTASVASIALSSYPSQISIGKKQNKEGKVRVQFMLAYQQYYCSLVNSLSPLALSGLEELGGGGRGAGQTNVWDLFYIQICTSVDLVQWHYEI